MKNSRGSRGLRFAVCGLLVLVLSIFLMACPPDDTDDGDPDPNTVPANVMTILRDDIGYKGDFPLPADVTYHSYDYNDDILTITWKDADVSKFAAYKVAWGSKVINTNKARAIDMHPDTGAESKGLNLGSEFMATINLTVNGGTDADYTVPANSIYFQIMKL